MLVSYSAMSLGDLKAVDKVIKVARQLDRYHGFEAMFTRTPTPRFETGGRRRSRRRPWPCRSLPRRSLRRKPSRRWMTRECLSSKLEPLDCGSPYPEVPAMLGAKQELADGEGF